MVTPADNFVSELLLIHFLIPLQTRTMNEAKQCNNAFSSSKKMSTRAIISQKPMSSHTASTVLASALCYFCSSLPFLLLAFLLVLSSSILEARELYFGPSNANQVCSSSATSNSTKLYFDTWCEHVNPFASTPQPLAEISIFNGSFSMECGENSVHIVHDNDPVDDDQLQGCYGVMGVVALEQGLVKAFRNGLIIQVSTESPYHQRVLFHSRLYSPSIMLFEGLPKSMASLTSSYSRDYVAWIQRETLSSHKTNHYAIYLYVLDDFKSSSPSSPWDYQLDGQDLMEVVQLKMMRDLRDFSRTYAVVLLKYSSYFKIIFFDCYAKRVATTWFIYPEKFDKSSKIRLDVSTQYGAFKYNAAMRIHPDNIYYNSYGRTLITIYSEKEVRVYEFDHSIGKNINFNFEDQYTSFYEVRDANTVITHASLIPEWIRRPLSMSYTTSCYNVNFPKSQNIFLGLGLKRKGATKDNYKFLLHHIYEFSEYSEITFPNTNTAGRSFLFNCISNQYLDPLTRSCKNNIEKVVDLNDELVSITSRLSDITTTVNGQPSYDLTGHLNPSVICQLPYLGNSSNAPNRTLCISDTQFMYCESSIFNSFTDSRNLYTFFHNYWHTQLFLQTSKDMTIYAMTIQLSNQTQGETILKQVNSMTLPGTIIHTFNSLNNQHLFLSLTRKKWEIEAEKRYQLVCDTLRNDPDNVFLKDFKDQCVLSPPKPFDENHFAMIVNSCLDGHLCADFSMNTISQDVAPGMFVDRSIYVTTCPLGSYCIKGIK